MSNQTAIPLIKTDDDSVNQIQQNTNKVFRNIYNQLSLVTSAVTELSIVGEIKLSALSLAQFQSIAGSTWILANGQSAVGTQYASKYGFTTVPTVTVAGTNSFIKVNE
jgi:hypothetical protein